MEYTWEYSDNVDIWQHGEFETIEDCIADAKENYDVKPGDTIAIGEVERYEITISADDVLDRMEESAYDACGEAAECWDTYSNRKEDTEKLGELSEQLTNCVKEWLKKYNRMPSFYCVANVRTVEVNFPECMERR